VQVDFSTLLAHLIMIYDRCYDIPTRPHGRPPRSGCSEPY